MYQQKLLIYNSQILSCGKVRRAVASDTRDPRFEYGHRQFLLERRK